MTLEAKETAGGGQKITAEAGDYVWLGSGSSGMVLLPDQVQISAADVYMKSPLNWIHKIIDEETTETLLDLYEEMKTAAPPIYAPDGTLIRRDGYDDILYSEELYDYFLNHVVGKEEKYKRENGEPYVTLYEQWLDETYGHSAMWYFWDYVFSIDGLQTMLDIGGFFFDGCDLVNAAIYLLRGRGKEAFWSFVGAVPFIGSVIMAKKGTKLVSAAGNISTALKTEEAVTGLTLTYKVEDKGTKLVSAAGDWSTAMKTGDAVSDLSSISKLEDTGTEFLKEVTPVVEEICGTVKNSTSGLAVAGQTAYKDLSVTIKMVDDTGTVILQTGGRQFDYNAFIKRLETIDKEYENIRIDIADISKIAQNTGMPEWKIRKIKDHVFFNEHILDDGIRRFDADPEIADAWYRLKEGIYSQSDIDLLNHEYFESKFESFYKTYYRTAHEKTIESARIWDPTKEVN